jgi:hypothetical protein
MVDYLDPVEARGKEHDPVFHEIAIAKQIIQERKGPLDLLRELISNSCAKEVGAKEVSISYTISQDGHVFTVEDDGIGMDYSNNIDHPGRLDKFFGLGLSEIVGFKGDEFSWKGLGSKLSYQSRFVEISTYHEGCEEIRAQINEPWDSIERTLKPKPKVFLFAPDRDRKSGTKITVTGHPPHSKDEPYSFDRIKNYLQHRTFIGFTKNRDNPPKIVLSVMGRTEEIAVGFPELKHLHDEQRQGTKYVDDTLSRNLPGKNRGVRVRMRGFYTWDDKEYGLSEAVLNTGLILSVKGIPYFKLLMRELGSGSLAISNPGEGKCCLIVECDEVQQVMNISRSDLIDDPTTDLFKETVRDMIRKIEDSDEHKSFRSIAIRRKQKRSAEVLNERKAGLERSSQSYVVYTDDNGKRMLMGVEPLSEGDALNILWKLEALNGLPVHTFQTLHYSPKGPDLVAHFRETETSDTERYCVIEAERLFTNYRIHEHHPPQFPKVICWSLGKSVKVRVEDTDLPYKKKARVGNTDVAVYILKYMPNISVATKVMLEDEGLI